MFYSSQLLSRKTPLGICWLASHSESKRLKRTQIFEFSISQSCDSIINPEAPLALRLSGQLLLGVVRIYQRKLAFLETDAKNAIDGLQRKEGSTQNVDLPDGGTAPEKAITLPGSDPTLFGGVGELFPSFNMSTPGGATGGSGSLARLSGATDLTTANDISDVFGSTRWTGSEDRFELPGASMDQQFSTELERLRDAADVDPGNAGMFYDGGDDFGPMDDIMDVPGGDLFDAPSILVDPGKTPGSVGHFSDMLKATPSVGMSPSRELPDVDGPMFDGGDDFGGFDDYDLPPPPATPVGKPKKKKKTFHLDIDANGEPATFLDEDETKRLLRNRAPLLKKRGIASLDISTVGIGTLTADKEDTQRLACISHVAPQIEHIISPIIAPPKPLREKKGQKDDAEAPEHVDPFAVDAQAYDDGGPMDYYDDAGPMDDYGDYDNGPLDEPEGMHTPMADSDVEKAILAHDGFTARTQSVLKHIKQRIEPSPGDKRAHEASSSNATVSLDSLVAGKSRLEACRWFFESLVLRNKGYVDLEQQTPYGEIRIIVKGES